MEDQHASVSAEGHGSDPRISVSGRSGGSERRIRARSAYLVPRRREARGCERGEQMNKYVAALFRVVLVAAVMAALVAGVTAQEGGRPAAASKTAGPIPRMPDGKPDLTGFYQSDAGGANYGLESHPRDFLTPGTRGVVVDPPDGRLPTQPWARAERIDRELPYRGYDDPTAHCF